MPTSGEIERELIRKRQEITIKDPTVCYYCKSKGLTENDKFCPHCAFPQQGTQFEMKSFIRKINQKKILLEEHKDKIKKARTVLYVLAVINAGLGILTSLNSEHEMAGIIVSVIIGLIFTGLGIWCNYNPFAAILTGFFVYVTLIIIGAVFDPISLIKGIVMKIFIISAFVYGYRAVRESQQLEKELADLKTATDFTESNEVPELPA